MTHPEKLWDKVFELRKQQKTVEEISKIVGLTVGSIRTKLSRSKIYNNTYKLEQINKLTEIERAYIAGIIDGEGSIIISKLHKNSRGEINTTYQCFLKITNTDRRLIEYIGNLTKTPIITNKRNNERSRRTFDVHLPVLIAAKLLNVVKPYLVIKKEQVDIVNRFRLTFDNKYCRGGIPKTVLKERDECYKALKKLHKREFK